MRGTLEFASGVARFLWLGSPLYSTMSLGRRRVPVAIGIVTAWALTPPLTWLLGYQMGMGALGGWIGLCAEIFLGAGILWWRLQKKHWMVNAKRSRAELQAKTLSPEESS